MTERTYTQEEVDDIRTEERFIANRVLISAGITTARQPTQYRESRISVGKLVANSTAIPDDEKEKFRLFLVMTDNCVPIQEIPPDHIENYNKIINIILAPKKDYE
jgi:hypothetical protein